MGIDIAGVRLLRYALSNRPLGDTVTLGRQEIHISPPLLRKECGIENPDQRDPFCEWLLKSAFAASLVESMDNSAYEQATIIHDNNNPIAPELSNRFDAVLDFGTLEHVFNFPQAIQNCISMCKRDGIIFHCLPTNNQCGHGFWQISPELFFSLYSEKNGFKDTQVFVMSPDQPEKCYRVKKPSNGQRAIIQSDIALVVGAFTRKARDHIDRLTVQQSDYIAAWSDKNHKVHSPASPSSAFKTWLGQYPAIYEWLHRIKVRYEALGHPTQFNDKNPWLERFDITSDNSGSRA